MSDLTELGLSATQKAISQSLDQMLRAGKVGPDAREAMINSFEMMYEYIPYAMKQKKNPTSGVVLAEFLAGKGMKTAKFLGSNRVNCGIAIVELLKSSATAIEGSSSPAAAVLPAPVLAWGLATLDLIEVGNSCDFAQEAFYQAFLRDSSHVVEKSVAAAGSYGTLP